MILHSRMNSKSMNIDALVDDFMGTLEIIELPEASMVFGHFVASAYLDNLYSRYNITFPSAMLRAVDKRRAEFLAGRVAARHVMRALQIPDSNVGIGSDREPVWPSGIAGSISHSDHKVASLVCQSSDRLVGIDVEEVLDLHTGEEITSQVLSENELVMLQQDVTSLEILVTIAFSAKETLYKALFPRVRDFFDFKAAEVVTVPRDGQVCLALTHDLPGGFSAGTRFDMEYSMWQQAVVTWFCH